MIGVEGGHLRQLKAVRHLYSILQEVMVLVPEDFRITSTLLMQGGLIFALLDIFLLSFLVLRVKNSAFLRLIRILPFITAVFYGGIWLWVVTDFWHTVYKYLFPEWSRWLLPIAQLILTGVIAWLATTFVRSIPGPYVLIYCLIGGLWGIVGHLSALEMGIASQPPVLQGVTAGSVIFIAFFEFIFYWGVIVFLCFLGNLMWNRLRWEV